MFLRPRNLLIAAIILGMALATARLAITGSVMGGDAVYYYCSLRSAVLDGDQDLINEYAHYKSAISPFTGFPKMSMTDPIHPETGLPRNKYPVGTSLLLAPFFLLAHVVSLLFNIAGPEGVADGYGPLYEWATAMGSVLWAGLGASFLYRLLRRFHPERESLLATGATVLATPWVYYATMEPWMSHNLSAALAVLFVWGWVKLEDNQDADWCWGLLGIVGGLAVITRYNDAPLLLLPLASRLVRARNGELGLGGFVLQASAYSVGALLAALPQILVNFVLYGSLVSTGYSQEGFTEWASPWLFYTLFNPQVGLFLWSPVLMLSAAGWLGLCRSRPALWTPLTALFLLHWYLVSAWWDVTQGHSFGNRLLLNCAPLFGLGLAWTLAWGRRTGRQRGLEILVSLFIVANGILAGLYCLRIVGPAYGSQTIFNDIFAR